MATTPSSPTYSPRHKDACRFSYASPKTARGRVRRQHFLPLTLLSIDYDFRLRSSLQRLREVRIDQPYLHIPINPSKQAILLFLAEFLTYATRDEQQNVPLFLFIRSSLLWLDETEARFANFHLVFMARMSRFLGFWPNLEDYHEGCYFDLRGATFTPLRPLHPDFLPPEDAAHVGLLMRISYPTMHVFLPTREERNRIAGIMLAYYRLHVPNMPDLRSLPVLRELFAGG